MELINSVPSYHSPGYYYNYVTHLLGFTPLRHEGKITGLAAYGDADTCIDIFRERLRYDADKFRFDNRGRWMTALAGYNCGEHRVMSVIRRQKDDHLDHFWDVFEPFW